jgi:hypothetical protein
MVLQTTSILNYELISKADNDIIVCALSMGPNNDVSSFKKLEFMLGKSS